MQTFLGGGERAGSAEGAHPELSVAHAPAIKCEPLDAREAGKDVHAVEGGIRDGVALQPQLLQCREPCAWGFDA